MRSLDVTPTGSYYADMTTTNDKLARLQVLQNQISALSRTGKVTTARVEFATAGRWSQTEILATLAMMSTLGLVDVG